MERHASVPTEKSERYLRQLVSHLGRKCPVEEQPGGTLVRVGTGTRYLRALPDALEITVSAPDQKTLDEVADVAGRHLERFGQRDELVVVWS